METNKYINNEQWTFLATLSDVQPRADDNDTDGCTTATLSDVQTRADDNNIDGCSTAQHMDLFSAAHYLHISPK